MANRIHAAEECASLPQDKLVTGDAIKIRSWLKNKKPFS